MKLSASILLITSLSVKGSFLRASEKNVSYDFSKFKCTWEAWGNEEKCLESTNKEGDSCSYCVIENPDTGDKSGLCVDPEIAPNMEQMNPSIKCGEDDSEDESESEDIGVDLPDYHDFKCSIEAFNDAEKCSMTRTDDGKEWCEYCSMDGPFGEQGLCLSPEHAKFMEKASPNLKCESRRAASNPITDCNLSGTDADTCLDPTKVNGSDCIWCDAGIGGFCFPASWKSKASHFLKCQDANDEDIANEEEEEKKDDLLDFDPSTLNSSCIKNGFSGSSADDCRKAVDDSTGEHCVFCKSTFFDGVGICLPSSYSGEEGRFYECDDATVTME